MANISYFYMNLCYERTYAEGVEMMARIHDIQNEYDFDKIAIVGYRIYEVQHETINPKTGYMQNTGKLQMLIGGIETSLLFDSEHTMQFLGTTFGLSLKPLNFTQRNELLMTDEVQAMGCWPAGDSMAVIDGILVIKLSEQSELYE